MRIHRAAGDQDAFDQLVRIVLDQRRGPCRCPARSRRRCTTMYLGLGELRGTKLHFMPGRESGAAAAAQIRALHLVDDLVGRHFEQRFAQALVAVVLRDTRRA